MSLSFMFMQHIIVTKKSSFLHEDTKKEGESDPTNHKSINKIYVFILKSNKYLAIDVVSILYCWIGLILVILVIRVNSIRHVKSSRIGSIDNVFLEIKFP